MWIKWALVTFMLVSGGSSVIMLAAPDPSLRAFTILIDLMILAAGCAGCISLMKRAPVRRQLFALPFYLRALMQLALFFDPSPNHTVRPLQPADGSPFVYAAASIAFSVLATGAVLYWAGAEKKRREKDAEAAEGLPDPAGNGSERRAAAALLRLYMWFFWLLPNGVWFAGYTPPLGKAAAGVLVALDALAFGLGCLWTLQRRKTERRILLAWPFLLRTAVLIMDMMEAHWPEGDYRKQYAVATLVLSIAIACLILLRSGLRSGGQDGSRDDAAG